MRIEKYYYIIAIIVLIGMYYYYKTEHLTSTGCRDATNEGYISWIFGGIPMINGTSGPQTQPKGPEPLPKL